MNSKIRNWITNPFALLLIAWGILNIVQARLTPLDNDEAYYWMYSKYLAWGYFDHPPMIALMIKLGYLFFHNELGVRIIAVLSQLIALSVIWFLTEKEKRWEKENILFFFMLVVILPICNIFGFVATPDVPLIFFTTIFLLSYKLFLEKDTWQNTVLMAISMSALMYSKYHGGLLIILIILSNLRLLKNIRFYMASFLALFLFFPHILWQYSNGFPSFKYHLIERVSGFNPSHVPEYLASQFFFQNPFILCVLIWIMIKVRSKNLFEKALYYIVVGFFTFFFISSFRYRVEPQWNAVISVPMIILVFNNLDYKPWIKSYIKWVAIIIFPLILFMRLASAIDFLPVSVLKKEFHDKKQWVKDIDVLAGNRPVVFTNSYQRPSVYTFYTGKFAYELNNLAYRKTEYDIWDFEEKVHGKEVLYVPHFLTESITQNFPRQVLSNGDTTYYKIYKDFQSLQKECVILENSQFVFSRSATNTIHFKIFDPYPYPINLMHKELPVVFQIGFIKNGKMEAKRNLDLPASITQINVGDTISVDCQFTLEDLPAGVYKFGICSETGALYDVFNSKFSEARIND
jgi:hypothetical protein